MTLDSGRTLRERGVNRAISMSAESAIRQLMRQVFLYPGEDGYWVAECPSLPGCISQGRTQAEAVENIREAIGGYVKVLEDTLC